MTVSVWLRAPLAGLMIALAVGCAGRLGLARRRGFRPDFAGDGLHAAMGVAMAGMLLPSLSVLPAAVWATGFGVAVLWFGWQVIGGGRASLAHLIECVAMVFMLLPATGWAPGSAFAGPSAVFALLLALCVVGCAVWTADTLVRGQVAVAAYSRIAMSLAMWYMLIQMV